MEGTFSPSPGSVRSVVGAIAPNTRFIKIIQLGKGNDGTVFHVYKAGEDGRRLEEYVLKVLQPTEEENVLQKRMADLELLISKNDTQHKNIIQHIGTFTLESPHSQGSNCLLMEYFIGKQANELLKYDAETTPELIFNWIQQALEGLAWLHANRVAHRDIKPDNILHRITENNELVVKLVDFGVAKKSKSEGTVKFDTKIGCESYWAPEIREVNAAGYSTEVDIWALAVSIFSCISGVTHLEFYGGFHEYIESNPDYLSRVPFASLQALLQDMLLFQPRQRPSAAQLLDSDIFFGWNEIREGRLSYWEKRPEIRPLLDMIHPAVAPIKLFQVFKSISELFISENGAEMIERCISFGIIEKMLILLKEGISPHTSEEQALDDFLDNLEKIIGVETHAYIDTEKYKTILSGLRDCGIVLIFLETLLQLYPFREDIIMKILCNGGLPIILYRFTMFPTLASISLFILLKHKSASHLLVHKYSVERLIYQTLAKWKSLIGENKRADREFSMLIASLPFKFCSFSLFQTFPTLTSNTNAEFNHILRSRNTLKWGQGQDKVDQMKSYLKIDKLIRMAVARRVCTNKLLYSTDVSFTQYVLFQTPQDASSVLCLSCARQLWQERPPSTDQLAPTTNIHLLHMRCSRTDYTKDLIPSSPDISPPEGVQDIFTLASPFNGIVIEYTKDWDLLYFPSSHKWSSKGATRTIQDLGFIFDANARNFNVYFEVKIKEGPSNPHLSPDCIIVPPSSQGKGIEVPFTASEVGRIAVGLASFLNPIEATGHFVGQLAGQYGYHSNGFIFLGSNRPAATAPRFFTGDVVGCGIQGHTLYFTLNGTILPCRHTLTVPIATELYTTISSHHNFHVQFQFQSPFKFDPTSKLNTKEITKSQILRKPNENFPWIFDFIKSFFPVIYVKKPNGRPIPLIVATYDQFLKEVAKHISDFSPWMLGTIPLNEVLQLQIPIPSLTVLHRGNLQQSP